jgi:hypothetical protein
MSALPVKADIGRVLLDVCYGSKADICVAKSDVRFTPNNDRKSGCLIVPPNLARPRITHATAPNAERDSLRANWVRCIPPGGRLFNPSRAFV